MLLTSSYAVTQFLNLCAPLIITISPSAFFLQKIYICLIQTIAAVSLSSLKRPKLLNFFVLILVAFFCKEFSVCEKFLLQTELQQHLNMHLNCISFKSTFSLGHCASSLILLEPQKPVPYASFPHFTTSPPIFIPLLSSSCCCSSSMNSVLMMLPEGPVSLNSMNTLHPTPSQHGLNE